MHDYFTPNLTTQVVNTAINDLIERTSAAKAELPRPYLGASIAGSECLRRVQFDWWCTPMHTARTREIFARGHYFEDRMLRQLYAAGFKFAPPEACAFSAVNGDLRGHADGIINGGPNPLNGAYFNYPFICARRSTRRTGARSDATVSKKPFHATARRSRFIKAIST
jgi:hypothetical protein